MVDQISNPMAGAKAYGAIQNLGGGSSLNAGATGDVSFGDLLGNGLQGAIDTMKNSEKVSADAVTGKANLLDVTQAVSSAKLTLDTVVAVRDNVIEAYQRIMQMPI